MYKDTTLEEKLSNLIYLFIQLGSLGNMYALIRRPKYYWKLLVEHSPYPEEDHILWANIEEIFEQALHRARRHANTEAPTNEQIIEALNHYKAKLDGGK